MRFHKALLLAVSVAAAAGVGASASVAQTNPVNDPGGSAKSASKDTVVQWASPNLAITPGVPFTVGSALGLTCASAKGCLLIFHAAVQFTGATNAGTTMTLCATVDGNN